MISIPRIANFNNLLREKGLTLICAESITAGLLSSTIASVSGASSILKGSIVTYDATVKTKVLGVDEQIIADHTAESEETTFAMCVGLRKLYPDTAIAVAVTGVASLPTTEYFIDKEVGQIYVSIWYKAFHHFETVIRANETDDQRNEIREKAVEFILGKIEEIVGV
ncbi:CinA family protein [Pedobacter sp. HDW13]|uniref:CinA family protein n=1 Tax=unclassified Pedobacter TaxID=2628915 RepID=UPI000F59707A|nr:MULTISPECIES: nicotinamide-nucleotide amidohydrolase family protein [unclassified Pedobacter]QIL42333.1 CinA family protein [Pedobacter sp. HDW13]RQO76425.1 hypothetical protein DBR40_10975 [Pedobacter sp. KBW01]